MQDEIDPAAFQQEERKRAQNAARRRLVADFRIARVGFQKPCQRPPDRVGLRARPGQIAGQPLQMGSGTELVNARDRLRRQGGARQGTQRSFGRLHHLNGARTGDGSAKAAADAKPLLTDAVEAVGWVAFLHDAGGSFLAAAVLIPQPRRSFHTR